MTLKSINTSPKKEIREKSKVVYDFSCIMNDVENTNREINKRIRDYEIREKKSGLFEKTKIKQLKK